MIKICRWLLIGAFASELLLAAHLDPAAIMKKNDEAKRILRVEAQAVLESRGQNAAAKVKRFSWWRKLDTDGVHYRLLTRFRLPAEIRGEGILFLEHAGSDPDILLYLPAYKKIRRVESSAQSGSFMASEFSYTDMLGYPVSDFNYRWQKEDSCDGKTCYVIESTPANDSVKARAGYERRLDWVRSDNFMVAASEFYGPDAKLLKKLKASQIVEVDPAHHKWMAQHLEMENLSTKKTTSIEFSDVKVNSDIPDLLFTARSLEKGQ